MELRLYSFVNFYLSSMQQGIQTGHAAVDLVRKYTSNGNPFNTHITAEREELVEQWADNHKTFIVLNGGDADGIKAATDIIIKSGFPWVSFREDEASLNGIQTCVAVVLPENVFNAKRVTRDTASIFSTVTVPPAEMFEYVVEDASGVKMTAFYPERHQHFPLIQLLRGSRLAA